MSIFPKFLIIIIILTSMKKKWIRIRNWNEPSSL